MRRYARLLIIPVLLLATASLGGCYVVPYGPRYAYAPPYYHHYWYR